MPDFLEQRLAASARKKHFTGRKAKQYIYGAMNDMGAMRGNQITARGRAMERKHRAKLQGLNSLRAA